MTQELNVTGTVTHESGAPVQIKVERGQRGGYGWEIALRGTDETELMSRIAACATLICKPIPPNNLI